jgi:hypothetical protein
MRGHESASGDFRGSRLRILPWAGGLLLAASLALLSGCGDLPLVDALQGDSPGELRFSPSTALIPLDTDFTFSVLGGVGDYTLTSAETLITVDEDTWIFEGKTSIATNPQDFSIQATDRLGHAAAAVVTVYSLAPLALDFTEVTLVEGASWTFTATDGLPPYAWAVNDGTPTTGSSYLFSEAVGSYLLSVTDFLGATQVATVEVVPDTAGSGAPLSLTPTIIAVVVGGRVVFTAAGGSGNYTFVASGGTITPALGGNPATYTAPAVKADCTVSLSDNGGLTFPVSAAVTVVTSPVQALVLVPQSPTVSAVPAEIQFTASGGTPPYTFSTNKPATGSIVSDTGLYTQHEAGNVVVTVRDFDGLPDHTLVNWQP